MVKIDDDLYINPEHVVSVHQFSEWPNETSITMSNGKEYEVNLSAKEVFDKLKGA